MLHVHVLHDKDLCQFWVIDPHHKKTTMEHSTPRVGHEHKLTKFLTVGTFCANNKETERLAELDNIVFTRAIHLDLLFNMSGLKICYSHKDKNISRILTLFRTTP